MKGALPILLSFAFILIPFVDFSFLGVRKVKVGNRPKKIRKQQTTTKESPETTTSSQKDKVTSHITPKDNNIPTHSAADTPATPSFDPTPNKNNTTTRPPLSSLVSDSEIIGDVQFLLDFAIIGHPKCGTDKQMHFISRHDEIQMYEYEVRSLRDNEPVNFVKLMYDLPKGKQFKRGYKAPRDVVVTSKNPLRLLDTYWPHTKLIVGLRHPVKWFESFYNYRKRSGWEMPPAETMVGKHMPQEVKFHMNLAQMGKTNPPVDIKEARLLRLEEVISDSTTIAMKNPVMLYESSQPFDANRTRAELYWKDLSDYIGVSKPLEPPKRRTKSNNKGYAIDICDEKFVALRKELIQIGKEASEWIQNYFMMLPDVSASSPEYFKKLLDTWQQDPCVEASEG